ncbi:tripeptidyl-peptidase, partial [Thraustotheca clavata]
MSSFTGFASKRWLKIADTHDARQLTWSMGLHAKDPSALQSTLAQVSNPDHHNYGRYLTVEESNALTAPSQETLDDIHAWLGHRRTEFSPATNVLTIYSTVGETRKLLSTDIAEYEHLAKAEGEKTYRILRASTTMEIPENIKAKITFTTLDSAPIHVNAKGKPVKIVPLSNLESTEAGKPPLATPDKIKQLYNVPGNITAKLATQSIAAFYDESWSPADLALFQSKFNIPTSVITQKGDRYNNVSNPTGEASLDIQYITALAPGSPTTVWTMNGSNPFSSGDEPFVS